MYDTLKPSGDDFTRKGFRRPKASGKKHDFSGQLFWFVPLTHGDVEFVRFALNSGCEEAAPLRF